MQRYTYLMGTVLFSLILLAAGCAKEVDTTQVSSADSPGGVTGDETSSVSGSGDAVQFGVDDGSNGSSSTSEDFNPLDHRAVYFEYDESLVSEEAQQIIRAHAEVLKENPDAGLHISGHADERGTREYNLALGDQRGEAVSGYFQEYGIDPSRISVISLGEEKPAAVGSDESAWSLNRRSEFDY